MLQRLACKTKHTEPNCCLDPCMWSVLAYRWVQELLPRFHTGPLHCTKRCPASPSLSFCSRCAFVARTDLLIQVENQLSPDSLQFWHSQKSQQGLSLSLAAHRPHSMPPPEVGHIQKHEGRQSSLSHANIMRHPPQASLTPTPANTPRFTSRPVSQQPQPRCNVLSNEHGLQQGAYNNSISIGNTHKELPTLAASEGPVVQLGSYNFSCPDNPQTVSSSAPPPEAVLQQSNYNNSTSPGNTGTAHSGLIPSGRPALRQGFYNNSIFPGNAHSSPLSLTLGDLDHSLPQGHMLSMPSLTAAASIFSKHSAQLQQDLTHQGNRIMAVHAATLQHRLNAGQSMTKATPAYQPLVDMAPNVPSPAACMGDMLSRALNWKQSQHLSQANLSLMQTSSLQADAAPEPDYLQEMYDATNLTVQQAPMQQASGYATNTLADQPGLAYPAADPNACSLYDTAFS